jgi:hypothetical protein
MCRQIVRTEGPAAGHPLYLAFLIGRAKSTLSSAFLRLFVIQSFQTPAPTTHTLHHNRKCDRHSPGGVHAFLRVQHLGRRMLFIWFVNGAVQAVRRSRPPNGGIRQEIADIPCFAAPPGDAHRARISMLAPFQLTGGSMTSLRFTSLRLSKASASSASRHSSHERRGTSPVASSVQSRARRFDRLCCASSTATPACGGLPRQ